MKPNLRMLLKLWQFIAFAIISVNASAQLRADFSASPVVGCPPLIVDFTDLSKGGPTSWQWDLGNGTTSGKQHPTTTYFDPGIYTVKLVVKNGSGIDSLIRVKYIIVNAPPKVKFGASDTLGCFPLKVKFTDSSAAGSGTISTWQWDFGDGTLSTQQHPSHTYTNAGSFTVSLRVVNSNGCDKVFAMPNLVDLSEGVKANFSFAMGDMCKKPVQVDFTNTTSGTGTTTYSWDFGDGKSSTATSPTNLYANAGNYTVKLVATNSSGCSDTAVKTNAINITSVKADFTFNNNVCPKKDVQFTNTSSPATVSSTWYFGDGTTSTSINPVKAYAVAGTYQVKLVNDFGTCRDSIVKTITVISKPTADFTSTNSIGCSTPLNVNFQNTSTNGATYFWNFGDNSTSTQQSPSHTYTTTGAYTVVLIATNTNGCSDTIVKTDLVKINPPRVVSIKNIPVKSCLPFTVSPLAVVQSAEAVVAYSWDFGDGFVSTDSAPSHTYTTPGFYTIKVKIRNAVGCTDSLVIQKAVSVGNKPKASLSAAPRDVCASVGVDFSDLSSNGPIHEWYWSFGDGGTSALQNPKHTYQDTGYFDVSLVATSYGCADTILVKKYIHINPPIANFDTSYTCSDRLTRKFVDKSIGAETWAWDFGDNSAISNLQNPSHTYGKPGLYKVTLTVTNGICVNITQRDVLVVKEAGKLTIGAEMLCRNARLGVGVDNVDKSNLKYYTWYFNGLNGGSPITTVSSPVAQSFSTAGVYPIAVVTTDVLSCRDTLYSPVDVKIYGPKVGVQSPISPACFGTTTDFKDITVTDNLHPITNYYWNYGDGRKDTLASGPFTHRYDTSGTFSVSLAVVDSYGCKDSVYFPAMVTISDPRAKFTISDTMVCPNVPVYLTNNSTGGIQPQYLWTFGDGKTSTQFSTSHPYAIDGDYQVKLNVEDRYGCKDSAFARVKVYPALADFAMSDSFSTCPPLMVDFTNKSQHFVNFSWDFGDGGKSTLNAPSHLYTYPGIYTVKLWVNNNGGCSDTLKKTVAIQGPTGVFTYTPKEICNPGEIDFVATTKNAVRYFWDFRDGTGFYSNQVTAQHTYTTPGTYVPKMILEDASGCPVPIVGADTIKVDAIKTNIIAINTVLCDSGYVSFADSTWTNDDIGTFLWEFGDGTKSTLRTPTHKYTKPGWYNIKLTATSKFGCTDVATLDNKVKIVTSPSIDIAGNLSACEPATLTFAGTLLRADTSKLSWSWDMGNGQTSNLQNPASQQYAKAGDYPVKVSVVNSDGCTSGAQKTASIHPIPVVSAGVDTVMCLNTPVQLTASGADSYTWNFDPTLSCLNCASPTANPTNQVSYVVTGSTVYGCTNKDSVIVKVKKPFKMSVNPGDTLCVGESFTLQASGADIYQWTPSTYLNNANIANPKATPANTITYQVTGKDDHNCFSDVGSVTLKVYPVPQIQITGNNPMTVQAGSTTSLITNSSADVNKWRWYPPVGLSCTDCPSPVASPKETTTYTVQATNDGQCVAKDDVTIKVICDNTNVFIPNTFSPNSDGVNDYFYPRSTGVFSIKSFKIFNRWGQIVFQKNDVRANLASDGWDGTMNGVKLSPDVYVYCVEIVCQNSVTFPIIGNVTLVK